VGQIEGRWLGLLLQGEGDGHGGDASEYNLKRKSWFLLCFLPPYHNIDLLFYLDRVGVKLEYAFPRLGV
jgi:hypothetical protein